MNEYNKKGELVSTKEYSKDYYIQNYYHNAVQVKLTGKCELDGKRIGVWKFIDKNGIIIKTVDYSTGEVIQNTLIDCKGNLMRTQHEDKITDYYKNGNIKAEYSYDGYMNLYGDYIKYNELGELIEVRKIE